jgi:flotillin
MMPIIAAKVGLATGFIIGLIGTFVVCAIFAYYSLLERCGPEEVIVFSGKGDNYEVVHSGRAFRNPFLHKVDRLDVTIFTIELNVDNAYSKGGVALRMRGMANVKIGSQKPYIDNAIERFLTTPKDQIRRLIKETLEGNLRGVLASMTPEEVNYEREKFEENISQEAEKDLRKIGIVLDTLKIQHIEDDHGYLNALGKPEEWNKKRDARIEEARNRAETEEAQAENEREAKLAEISSERKVAKADADRQITDAKSKGEQLVAESNSDVGAKIAKAEANVEVEKARVEQTKEQVEADIIEPAKAEKEELVADAKAQAAQVVEDGKADVEAMREVLETWQEAGEAGRPLLLTQKFDDIVSAMLSTIDDIEIEKITSIDSGIDDVDRNGTTPMKAVSGTEQLKEVLGIDLPGLVKGAAAVSGNSSDDDSSAEEVSATDPVQQDTVSNSDQQLSQRGPQAE